jgi:hypothetical protein
LPTHNETRSACAGGSRKKEWPPKEMREMLFSLLQAQTVPNLREGLDGHSRTGGSVVRSWEQLGSSAFNWGCLDEGQGVHYLPGLLKAGESVCGK